jgi:hypothetical protein
MTDARTGCALRRGGVCHHDGGVGTLTPTTDTDPAHARGVDARYRPWQPTNDVEGDDLPWETIALNDRVTSKGHGSNRPRLVGVTGFEPATSSSRTRICRPEGRRGGPSVQVVVLFRVGPYCGVLSVRTAAC